MKAMIYSLSPDKRQAMTKQSKLLAAGVGGAFFRAYIRRQCLQALRDMQALDDSMLAVLGVNRSDLADLAESMQSLQKSDCPPPRLFQRGT